MPTPLGHERVAATTWAGRDYATCEFRSAGYLTPGQGISAGPALDAAGPAEIAGDAADASDPLTAALEGARRGDSESFRILYRETQPRLLRYLRYHVAAEAEDIASEAWLQVSRDLPKFEGDYDNFRRWVTTIARNRAIDHVRRTARQPPAVPVPLEELTYFAGREDTADRAIESIATDRALNLIGSLPPDQAEAVLLRVVAGLTAGRGPGRRQANRGHQDRRLPRPETPGETHGTSQPPSREAHS